MRARDRSHSAMRHAARGALTVALRYARALERGVERLVDRVDEHGSRASRAPRRARRRDPSRCGAGSSTVLMPARAAASTLSLMPPTGSTRPRSEISPVIATSPRARRPGQRRDERRHERDARRRAVLRHGARRHVQVDLARRERARARMPSDSALARTQESAASADSCITSPSWPVRRSRTPLPPGMPRRLDEQDVAAVAACRASPTTTPGCVGALGRLGQVRRRAERLGDERRVDAQRRRTASRRRRRARAPCASASRSWRSRLRTPASRVYSCTTCSSGVVRRPRPAPRARPCASSCFGTR